ncbi:hypothetical protein NDU88_003544 [Pleurodeles waltl]|uniref:Uncharacterized protein n=1 Tax=Pleurodeles waltl TaxID=8319 RepID=A0AAV7LHC7_PLEWA|nr:hypothetical protein NDU88_003544 [Pleurodeles waltl]
MRNRAEVTTNTAALFVYKVFTPTGTDLSFKRSEFVSRKLVIQDLFLKAFFQHDGINSYADLRFTSDFSGLLHCNFRNNIQ